MRCTVKPAIARPISSLCTVKALDDDRIEVIFDEPVAAVTPGQSAVFYNGGECASVAVLLSSVCRCRSELLSLLKTREAVNVAKNYYDITLALAGICQSARPVQQLAHRGICQIADALHVSLNEVLLI